MSSKLNITEARKQLLSLPEKLSPGEWVEVMKHNKTVLRIVRAGGEEGYTSPFSILDQALTHLPKTKKSPPKSLAVHYKDYLYGKKTRQG
jgi:antitoxin (DNA-binding transcriptional repressor) of toxin-antitoxin stability system